MPRCKHAWIYSPALYSDPKGKQWKHRWCVHCDANQWSKLTWKKGKHPSKTRMKEI